MGGVVIVCRRATHNPIPQSCELSFFTTVYLVLLTATTLGLGDIFPADDVARCGLPPPLLCPRPCCDARTHTRLLTLVLDVLAYSAMTLAILLPLFYIIPREISKLSELLNKQSKYSRRFQGSVGGHVVVCGSHIQRAAAEGFLTEFYHADHGEQKRKVRRRSFTSAISVCAGRL